MPIYEYQCKTCKHRFEKIQQFSDRPVRKCPQCGGPVEKLLSKSSVQFKGSGWYATDYARKGSAGDSGSSDGADSGSSSGAEGSDSKTAEKSESKKAEAKAGSKGESRSESKSESKSESRSESRSESKTESRTESKPSESKSKARKER